MSAASVPPLRLTAPDAALDLLLSGLPGPVAPRRLPSGDAVGRVLAEDLVAAAPVPATRVALADGWAVAAAETDGAGPYAPMPLATLPARLSPGDPLPPGTDAVLPLFDVTVDGPFAQAIQSIAPGEGVRGIGEEIADGQVLRRAGERLAARDLPALALLGLRDVGVRAPRCAWIPAGDQPGGAMLASLFATLFAGLGADLARQPVVPADADAIAEAICAAASAHDLLLVAGGTGAGVGDRGAAALAAAGTPQVHGLGARPGMSAGGGQVSGKPVLLLPGPAEDALAIFYLLLRPLLLRMSGAAASSPVTTRLARSIASTVGLAELVPLRLGPEGGEPLAVGALPAGVLAAADAILVVPAASEGYEAGATIPILPV